MTRAELTKEREAYLARMRKRYATDPPPPMKLPKHMRERTCHIVRWDKTEDYLPPDDLIRPKHVA